MMLRQTIPWADFSDKHKLYIRNALKNKMNVAEGAIRSGKTIDHCIIAAAYLEKCRDRIHLASGSTIGNAKLNIGVCNGFGLENLFRGRCKWGKYRDNEALFIQTQTGEKVVVFAGGGKADSYKRILGNSYGLWIATEINEHYDSDDSRTSFIKVAFGRQAAALDPLVLWDLNPCGPNHKIYADYIDAYKDHYVGGYQYEHFTIDDNLSISAQRKEEIKSQYNPESVWYRRDILGERCTAEGLIYPLFADKPSRYEIEKDNLPDFRYITVGVDFGGNKSAYAFVATGITYDWAPIALRSLRIPAKGVSVEAMINRFTLFCDAVERDYLPIDYVYADSAEQAIINSMDAQTKWRILGSVKGEIIDRIRAMDTLLSTDRFKYVSGQCDSLVKALCDAVWDDKKLDDVRLDDGTSDIDTLDAWEYSWSAFIRQIVRR
jgi:PBSX family phage terminase large subunit